MRTQPPVEIALRSTTFGDGVRTYLEQRVHEAMRTAPAPVLHARASIDEIANPAADRPVEVDASVDVNGVVVSAHTRGNTATEAIDALKDVLRHEFEQLARQRQERRQRPARSGPGEWRHGDLPGRRPGRAPRPVDEREIVSRRTWTPAPATVEEAADDLDRLGHDFQLFTEATTGADALLRHDDSGRLELLLATDTAPVPEPPGTLVHAGAPTLTVPDAIETLEAGDLPLVFFRAADSGRGAVLYHRDDGHYGLVTAPTD